MEGLLHVFGNPHLIVPRPVFDFLVFISFFHLYEIADDVHILFGLLSESLFLPDLHSLLFGLS